MPENTTARSRWGWLLAIACVLLACRTAPAATTGASRHDRSLGVIELDTKSEFSHIRVRRLGNVRNLLFVRDDGEEALETSVNLKKPYDLLLDYARHMFTSYLFRPQQSQVLIIGLGGGAMVHFLQHYDPQLQVEAVEIDPLVVQIAASHFGLRSGGNVNIITADAFRHLESTPKRYDVIYMDAFLKPSPDTDPNGVPQRLKTLQFYKGVQEKLDPQGLLVFNLNTYAGSEADVRIIREAFPQVYLFRSGGGNMVAVASRAETREDLAVLKQRAKQIDQRFKTGFSFQSMLRNLAPP